MASEVAPSRRLAEAGHRPRREAADGETRLFRRTAPAVLTTMFDELDLARIVRVVIEEIDLPGIIRTATGPVAGESVRDARIQAGRVFPGRGPKSAMARHDRGG